MLLVFEMLSNDGWGALMAEAQLDAASGLCSQAAGNCGSWIALPYFLSFQILGPFVFLNVIVAVILEHFSSLDGTSSTVAGLVRAHDIERFQEVWRDFDTASELSLPRSQMPSLLLALRPPLGLKSVAGRRAAVALCMRLELMGSDGARANDAEVSFDDVIETLIANNLRAHGLDSAEAKGLGKLAEETAHDASEAVILRAVDTGAWDRLRQIHHDHELTKDAHKRDPHAMQRFFALSTLSEHMRTVRGQLFVRLKRKRDEKRTRRDAEGMDYVSRPAAGKAAAIATAICDNMLTTTLPPPTRLPPPQGAVDAGDQHTTGATPTAGHRARSLGMASPAQEQGSAKRSPPPKVRLPPLAPMSPYSSSPTRSRGGAQFRSAYDRHLNPQG